MKKNSYVVFGLGAFGYSLAETLGDSGYEVMVVDMIPFRRFQTR